MQLVGTTYRRAFWHSLCPKPQGFKIFGDESGGCVTCRTMRTPRPRRGPQAVQRRPSAGDHQPRSGHFSSRPTPQSLAAARGGDPDGCLRSQNDRPNPEWDALVGLFAPALPQIFPRPGPHSQGFFREARRCSGARSRVHPSNAQHPERDRSASLQTSPAMSAPGRRRTLPAELHEFAFYANSVPQSGKPAIVP